MFLQTKKSSLYQTCQALDIENNTFHLKYHNAVKLD